jgi:hypothetical protein
MRDPLPFRNVQIDLVRNSGSMSDHDPRALIGNIANEAGQRFATIVEVNSSTQALGATWEPAPLVHLLSPT